MSKIVLFGATGYTGRLTAAALVARGIRPVLAARNATTLGGLSDELGGLETAVADVTDPASVRALLSRDDVIVSTVGPFLRYGQPALDAALDAGAHYLDSTGEGPFIRAVFERDRAAREANIALLTAFGFDFVPGNLAGALALQHAPDAVGLEICYGIVNPGASGGTQASIAGMIFEKGFALRGGTLAPARLGGRIRDFDVDGKPRTAVSVPGSEHLTLVRTHPELRDVDVYLAMPRNPARAMQFGTRIAALAAQVAPLRRVGDAMVSRAVKGSTGGPSSDERARTTTWIVAEALDAQGRVLHTTRLDGVDPYGFTGAMLAWGADKALTGALRSDGALGPGEAFGLAELTAGATEAGLTVRA